MKIFRDRTRPPHIESTAATARPHKLSPVLSPLRHSFDFPAAILTGLALAISFSGKDRFWAAWLGLIPSLYVLYRAGFRRTFGIGAVVGAVLCAGIWYPLPAVTAIVLHSAWTGFFYLALVCGFYALSFGALFLLIRLAIRPSSGSHGGLGIASRVIVPACLWVAFEYGYAVLLQMTTQTFVAALGYSQWNHPAVIQAASIGGVHAVSFILVAFNAAVAYDLYCRRFVAAPLTGGCIALCLLAGYARLHAQPPDPASERSLRVAVLQGDIPGGDTFSQTKGNFLAHRYLALGDLANRAQPDLIVWTETAVPWPLREDDDLVTTMLNVTAPSRASHILGTVFPVPGRTNDNYNSVIFIRPNGDMTAQYNKRYLLSFIEKTVDSPFLRALGVVMPENSGFFPGTQPPIFDTPLGRIGVMICNENIYPAIARECVSLGAEFLVNPANDYWFREIGLEAPTDGHLAVALFRAVETRRDMVIANNVGISAILDDCGRILARSQPATLACISGSVNLRTGHSFYVMAGDLFAHVCAVIGFTAVILSFIFASRSRFGAPVRQQDGRKFRNGKPR